MSYSLLSMLELSRPILRIRQGDRNVVSHRNDMCWTTFDSLSTIHCPMGLRALGACPTFNQSATVFQFLLHVLRFHDQAFQLSKVVRFSDRFTDFSDEWL